MGKGGGKCASRERSGSSVASRTPRLPAKPHNVTPHQSSAKAKDVDRAADTDSATLEPFIPKKMGSSQVEEDDDIDTNVMFDQQEIHSHVSDSGRRLLGSPSSEVQSAYNTAMPSPSRSFSSGGGRSPDAFHDAPDELQHFQASPNHPRHIKSSVGVSQQGGVIANTSQSSFDSTRPRFQDDDDLFPSKETIIPTSSNNSAVVHLGLRKRAIPFHATPSESKNVSSTWNTEAPIVGGSGEETSSPITIISQSFGLPQPQLGVTPQPHEPSEQATNIEVATPPKQKVDMKEGVHTQESTMPRESGKLSDNWELVPRELGSGSSSPVLVTMSKSTKASEVDPTSQLEAMKTENFKNLKFKEKEIEDDSQQPTNEQEENMKSMASKPFLSEHVVEGLPKEKSDPRQLQNDQPFEEEADTVRSLGSDQSDDIETHSINGDGGGYVFLGSPQHEESHDIEKLKDDKDFNKGVPIETLEQIEQRGHVQELPHVPIEKEEESKEAKPTFEEAAHSLGFPTNPPIEEIQKDAILEALVEIPPPTQGKEPKIEAPIEEPKTSIQEDEALIVVEQKEAPIETLNHIKKHVDVLEPLEVAFEKKDKPKEVEPSFEEVRRSLELPISHPIQETQHNVGVKALFKSQDVSDVKELQIEAPIIKPQIPHKSEIQGKETSTLEEPYVPSIQQPQDKDVKPTTIEDEDHTPIVKEDTSAPTQIPDGRQKDNVVEAPFEVPTRKEVEPEAVEPSFEQVQRSLDLPIPHPVEETQGDVGIEALQEGQHATKVEESNIDVPIMEPQVHPQIEAQEKEAPTLEEPYVPSTKQPQDEDDQLTSIEEEGEIPIVKEDTINSIQTLHELPQDGDVDTPFEVATKDKVEPEEVQSSFEEVLRSLELPISHPIEETLGDVGVDALLESQDVSYIKEPQIQAPITEPQILQKFEVEEKEAPTIQQPYVPSNEQAQDEDVEHTSIEDEEDTPILKENKTRAIQRLDKLPQNNDVHTPLEVPIEHRLKLEDVKPSFEKVPTSLDLPINHPDEEIQRDVGVKTLQEGQHVLDEEQPKIDPPIAESQILPQIEAQEKEALALEEPYVPSTQQPQEEDLQPTSIEDQEEIPIVKEETTDPIQRLAKLPQHDDVHATFEVPTEDKVEPKDVEPSFEEVPRSVDLPITHPIDDTQGDVGLEALQAGQHVVEEEESKIDAPITEPQILPEIEAQDKEEPTLDEPYVPSIEQSHDGDVQPTSIEDREEIPIVKKETSDPIQRLDNLAQDDDVQPPFEVPIEHRVELKEVEPSVEEVPTTLELPIIHPIEETEGDVGLEALEEGQHVVEEEESKIDAPITKPQILPEIEAHDKEEPTLEEPYVPFTQQPQEEDLQPTSIEDQEKIPILKEETTDPIQRLDKLPQDDDVHAPFEVPTEHKVEPKDVQPSFEEVPRSLDLPITHPIDETKGDVGVKALQEGQHVVEEEESKIDVPIPEPQNLPEIEAQDKTEPTLEEPYVPSSQQPQEENVRPTSIEDHEEIPIVKEETTVPIQRLDKFPQDDDVHAPFEVPTEYKIEPKDVEPSFEQVPRSLDLPITHPIDETQGDVGVEALQEGQHVVEEEESKIDAPITEPQILSEIEAQDKEEPTLEEPYVPSIEQSQTEDIQPTSIEEEEKTPIVKEDATDPTQRLDKLAQDDDVHPPFEVPIEHRVEPKEVEPSFEEVPTSLDLPITHPFEETQGDVGVELLQQGQHVVAQEESKIDAPITEPQILPELEAQDKGEPTLEEPYVPSTKQPREEDAQPTSIDDHEEIPIVKEETTDPIQRPDKLPQDDDVHAPFEVPTEHKVEAKDVEPSFEEVPRSLDLPITHPIDETQGDVGVEALQEGQHVVEEEESKIDAPITEPQILPEIEAQDKGEPTLEEPYVASTQQPQEEVVQPKSIEYEEEILIVKEETSDPIQRPDKLPQDDDVPAPFEVRTQHQVEAKAVEPSFQEVPRSMDLPITHPIDETQGDVGVEVLQEGQHVVKEQESKIDAPNTKPQILSEIEAQDKEEPTLEEPYVPSTQQPQEEVVQPTSIDDEEEIPIVKEEPNDPIQRIHKLPQEDDVHAPFEIPMEHKVGPKDVEPSFEEVPGSLDLPITHPIHETQGDDGGEALQEGQHVVEEEESKIDAPITEPQILPKIEAQDKGEPTLEEPYVPSTQQPQEEVVQPKSIQNEEEIPIVKEETTDPNQRLDKLPQDDDVSAPFEVPTEHQVEAKDVQPSFEEVPRSLDLPMTHPIDETQGDVGVEALQEDQHVVQEEESKTDAPITEPQILPEIEAQDKGEPTLEEPYVPSTQQPQEEVVQPTSIEDQEEMPIVKEEPTDPIQRLDKLPQEDDVQAPFEIPTEHKVEPKDVEPSFTAVPRSLDLPITHPIDETQGDVGVEALQEGQHVVEEEESKIDAPNTEHQILLEIQAQDKGEPTLEEPYVPSTQQPQEDVVQPTSIEDQEEIPFDKEGTTDCIQRLDKLPQDDDAPTPFEVPTEHKVEPNDVEPSFEEVPRSLDLPITHPIDETQGDVGVEALQQGQHVVAQEESKIDAPITEPQILPKIEAEDKGEPTLEEQYVPSTKQPQEEDAQPTSIEDQQEIPSVEEETTSLIERPHKLPQEDDVLAPFEVPTEHKVEPKDMEPSFREVPTSLDLPIIHPIAETEGDVGVEALEEAPHVVEEEESKIDAPITEAQILSEIQVQDKEEPTLQEAYVPSTQQPQEEVVQPTSIEDEEEIPIVKEETIDPIQRLEKSPQDDDVPPPFEVPTEHKVEPKDVEPSFEEVPRSLDLPITHAIDEIQGDVGVEVLQEGQHVVEEEESKIDASITKPQILPKIEAQNKEEPTLEEPYVPSTQQPQEEDIQPTSKDDHEEIPIVKEETADRIQGLDKLPQDDDVHAPFEVPTEHKVEPKDVEPSFEEVPRSLDLPITHPIDETQGDDGVEALQEGQHVVEEEEFKIDAPITKPQILPEIEAQDKGEPTLEEPYVASTQQPQEEVVQPKSIEYEEEIPIVKEETTDPIQRLDKLPQDDDVPAPFEVPTEHQVEAKDVQPSFEEVPRSLDLPITHPIDETQADVEVEALQEGPHVIEEKESKIDAPITEPQTLPDNEAQDKAMPTLEEPYVPSIEQSQDEDVQPTSTKEEEKTPILNEEATDPIQRLDKLEKDNDVHPPFEVAIEHRVVSKEVEPSFEELPTSLDLAIIHPIYKTQGDFGVEALEKGQHVVAQEESKIDAPITEAQILLQMQAQDKKEPTLQEADVPSTQQPQEEVVQPTSIENQEEIPIVKEELTDPIQRLDKLPQEDDVHAPFEIPTEHKAEPKDVEPSFEEVPRSLDLPITHPIDETQGDDGVEALQEGQHVVEEEESKIDAPITKPQILPEIEAQDNGEPTLEEPYVASTQQPQEEVVQPKSIEYEEEIPIVKEETTDPIQRLDKLPQDDDVPAPFEVPTEHQVGAKDVQPSFEEVPRSLDLPITHPIDETQGDVGVEALQEGQHVVKEEESKIDAPITKPQILPNIKAQDKEEPTLEEPYVPSIEQSQDEDVQGTSTQEEEKTPIVKEEATDPIQRLDKLAQDDDVHPPFDVPIEHRVEPKEVEPGFEEVPTSLDVPIIHPIQETQGDVVVKALEEGQHVVEEGESKIDAPITEAQILHEIKVQDKEEPTLEESYVPSTQQPQEEVVQPTSIEDEEEIPIVKEEPNHPIQRLHKLPQEDDVHAPFEIPTEHKVGPKDVEPSFEEVPRSLDLPITHPIDETQGDDGGEALQEGQHVVEEEESKIDAPITEPKILPEIEAQDKGEPTLEEPYVPSTQQPQEEVVQPKSIEDEEEIPILKEETTDPNQRLDKLPQDDDVSAPFEVPTEHEVEGKDVQPNFEEVPRSLDLPITHPIDKTQGDLGVEALQEGQHVVEEEESKIDAPITEPQILPKIEAQDKGEPTLEEPYVPSTQQPQEEDVQPTSIEDEEEMPIVKEEPTDPIQRLDKLPQDDDVQAPFEIPTEHKVEPKDVEPRFEEVPRSLDLPITRAIDETQGDVGGKALQEGQHVVEEEESKIDAPITEPQILRENEAQNKEEPTLEEPYVPSTQQPQEEVVQPTSIEDEEEIPIVREETSDPIQRLDKLPHDDYVPAPFEVPIEHQVEAKDVQPSFEEEGQHVVEEEESKIDAQITEPQILPDIEAQHKEEASLEEPYVPSIEQSQEEDVQPTSTEEEEKTPIVKEETTDPIQKLDKLAQDDVHPPFDVPIEHRVEPKEVEPSFEEVPTSLDIPIIHPVEETQGDVVVEASEEGQHVVEEEESKIDAPITKAEILPGIEAQDKEEPTLEEPCVPSTQQPQEEVVQPTTIEDQEEIPSGKEEPTDPIQRLDKLPQDDDLNARFEVPTEHNVEPKDVEPSFEEVPRSLDLSNTHPIDENQGDVGVEALQEGQHVVEEEESKIDAPIKEPQILPEIQAQDKKEPTLEEPYVPSSQQPQVEDVQPTSIEDQEEIPIVKEEPTDPIQRVEKLPQEDDVHARFEFPTEHKVEPKDVEPSFEEVPRSSDLLITHPIDKTQGDVGVEALQEGQHVMEEEESKIDAPITEPQFLPEIEAHDKGEPTLEEPYVPFTQQPQEDEVEPTSIQEKEEIPTDKEETTDPIQRLDKLPQDDDVHAQFVVPTEPKAVSKDVESSFEEVPRSLDLPITHPIDETQRDVGIEPLQEDQHVVEEAESKIDALILEPQILPQIEAQDKEEPTLEEPYFLSIEQSKDEDVQPTSTEEEEKTPIVKKEATDPIQRLDKLTQDNDVHPPFEVPRVQRLEPNEVEPSFEEVPTSLDLPIIHPIEETQGDVGVEALEEGQHVVKEEESKIDAPITEPQIIPEIQAQDKVGPTLEELYVPSTQQPQEEDIRPTSIEDEEEIPIVKEETTDRIQRLEKLPQDDDVLAPFEVPTEHKVEPKDVEPSFEEVPRSLDLAITHPIDETQGDVGVEALQEGQHVVEEEESKIDAPITEPQILPEIEAQDKEEPTLEEPYVPSTQQPQEEDVQPTSIEDQEEIPIVQEEPTDPIQRLDKLPQDDDVYAPFEVPTEHKVDPKNVEPSFEEVPRSLDLPITHPIDETSIKQSQDEDVQPTCTEEEEKTPIVKEEAIDPTQRLEKLPQDDDVHPPFEVPIEHRVEPKEVEPNVEEVATSLELPIIQPIEETQGDFGLEALEEGQHVVEEEESKNDAPITEAEILPEIEAQDKQEPTLEEPYVPSSQQPQEEDVQPTSIADEEEIPIVKEETTDPIQKLDKLPQDDDVHPPFQVPIEHRVEPKEVEPSVEEVPTTLELPIIHPIEETEGDVGLEALEEGQHVVEEEESKIGAPITEAQILLDSEAEEKEKPTLDEPYVPSIEQSHDGDVQPTSIEDREEIPIVKKETSDPIQKLDKLAQDDDVQPPFEVPIEHRVDTKEVEPSFKEVPSSLDLPIIHRIHETQGDIGIEALQEGQHVIKEEESKIDATNTEPQILPEIEAQYKEEPTLGEPYVPSTQQQQEENVRPTSIEDQEAIPIVKEETTDPIQRLHKFRQDDDVHAPFEVPTEHKVEPNNVEPSFKEVPRSLDLPITHPIDETQWDVGVEALQEGQHAIEEKESKIHAPITEPQIVPDIEAQDKEEPTLEEPYVPSTQQPQEEDVQPTSIEDQEEIPIVKEETTDPIQRLNKLPQDDDVHAPFEVPTEHKVEPKDVEPSFEEVPRSWDLPITDPIDETQGNVGVKWLQEGQHVVEEEESKIDAPITEPRILPEIEAQDNEEPTLEEPYVPFIEQSQDEDVQPTSIDDQEEIPIVKEETTDPIPRLDKFAQGDDVHPPFEVPIEYRVEPKEVGPSFEEVPSSLDVPIMHPIDEIQGDVGVEALQEGQHVVEEEESKMDPPITEPQILPEIEAQDKEEPTLEEPYVPSIEQSQDEDVQPTSIDDQEEIPIFKEETTDPIQRLDKLAQDDDVYPPFEVPIEHRVEPKEVEPSFEEVPSSLDLPIIHPSDETQGDVGVEALQEGQHVVEEEESKMDAPITKPQILLEVDAQDKEEPTLEEPYVRSTQQPQEEDVQPTSIEDQEEIPIVKEDTADPIQRLDKFPQDDDVHAPFEVPTEHKVEPKDVEPSFEEVPRSLDLPITHPIDETQGDVGVHALEEGQHVVEEEESKIDAPITELQILPEIEAQDKEEPTLEEPYVPSSQQPQQEDVQPTSIEDQEEIPIVKEELTDPIQGLDKLLRDNDVHAPFEVPTEHKVEPKDVEPSFEEVPRSLDLPITHPIDETQGDVGVKALQEGEHVVEEEESKIDAPITEPQILPEIEAQDKEEPTLEEPYVPSIEQSQDEDVQPTSIDDQEEIPIFKEETTDPIQRLDKLAQDDDVYPPFEVPIEHRVEPKEVEPSFEEVPSSLDLPIIHPIDETQGDVGVEALQEGQHVVEEEESKMDAPITKPQILLEVDAQDKEEPTLEEPYVRSTQQPQEEDVQPISIEDQEEIPIVKEKTTDPIQRLDKLPQDDDVHAPFEVLTEHKVEPKDVEPSFEKVPRSLDLPITHPIDETQGDFGVEGLQEGQHVVEEEESKIDAPIIEPQILPEIEAQDKEERTLEEPYVPSIEESQDEDVQPTSTEEEEKTPIVKEEATDPIQRLDKLAQDDDVHPPFEVPIEHRVEPKEVEPSFEEVPTSLDLPITHPIEETQGDVGVETLQQGQHVVAQEESKIDAPITEPQILPEIEAQDKGEPTLEEPYVPTIEQSQDEDVQPTSTEEAEKTPIVKEEAIDPIQRLDKLAQDDDVHPPFEVPIEQGVKPEGVQSSFEKVPRSLELPINQPIEETQDDVGVETLVEGQDISKVKEPQIEAPTTEPQAQEFEAQEKEIPMLEEQHIPSTKEPEMEDVKVASIEKEQETPLVKEDMSTPIQTLEEVPQHRDIEDPFDITTEKEVETKEVEPSFEEVPSFLEPQISQPIKETQDDVEFEAPMQSQDVFEVVEPQIEAPITKPQVKESQAQNKEALILKEQHIPSIEELEVEDVAPVSIEEEEETPIVKEEKNTPIQTIDELPQHGDVEEPFEVPTKKEVEPKEVELGFEEVARSLELPLNRPIEETQEHVGVESPINPPIEETREDVEVEGFQLVEDAFPLENVPSILIQQATTVEGDNWRTWKRELEANAMDKLFAQENLTPKETKNSDILEGPWPGVGSALEESIVSTKDPCGNDEKEIIHAEEAETMENKVELGYH
ncbi:hypothetical protein BDL97_17G087100 [Sphagnum fallax]|nr:hypothetical protein BDL97_17G087100 [Sphagnum fallax]